MKKKNRDKRLYKDNEEKKEGKTSVFWEIITGGPVSLLNLAESLLVTLAVPVVPKNAAEKSQGSERSK